MSNVPTNLPDLFAAESEKRTNTSPNAYAGTRDAIAKILSVDPKASKAVHVNLYRNLSRLGGSARSAPFVVLEWKLGDELLSANDPEFYSQAKDSRETAALNKILTEAAGAKMKAIVVGFRDEPPGAPVERRIVALAYREHAYSVGQIDALATSLGLNPDQVTMWPAASIAPPPLPPGGSGDDGPGKLLASTGWRPRSMLHVNLVLEGVPGTGKTHWIKTNIRTAFSPDGADIGALGDGEFAITLHPASSYEDFVEGLRPGHAKPTLHTGGVTVDQSVIDPAAPGENNGWFFCAANSPAVAQTGPTGLAPSNSEESRSPLFQVHDGFFLRACAIAAAHPEKGFVVLLDEFNRCNVPKVLGDLLTTLESSKRAVWTPSKGWSTEHSQVVTLPYSGRRFFVPSNVIVIATMNTTDRSVTGLDGALRRRFAFERIWPIGFRNGSRAFSIDELFAELQLTDLDESDSAALTTAMDVSAEAVGTAELLTATLTAWGNLNEALLLEFGPDGMLGHSYLFDMQRALRGDGRYWSADAPAETLREHWNKYLLPQLVEVFENGNAASNVNIDTPLLKRLRSDLASLGTLRLEQPGKNPLLRRVSLVLWP